MSRSREGEPHIVNTSAVRRVLRAGLVVALCLVASWTTLLEAAAQYPPPAEDCAQTGIRQRRSRRFRQQSVFQPRQRIIIRGAADCALPRERVIAYLDAIGRGKRIARGKADRNDGSYEFKGKIPKRVTCGHHDVIVHTRQSDRTYSKGITVEGGGCRDDDASATAAHRSHPGVGELTLGFAPWVVLGIAAVGLLLSRRPRRLRRGASSGE